MIYMEIFQHPFLDMWFSKACWRLLENYKILKSEITVLSAASGVLCKYVFVKAGLYSQFFLFMLFTLIHCYGPSLYTG